MALKPPESIASGLAVAGVVYAIHTNFTPSMADMSGLPAGNSDVDSSERQATWLSVGVVAGVSLLAKDPTIFVIGSGMTIALAWMTRHAVWTDPKAALSGAVAMPSLSSANDLATGPAATATTPVSMYQSEFV